MQCATRRAHRSNRRKGRPSIKLVAFKTPRLSPQTSRQHYYIGHTNEKEAAPDPCAYQYALTDLDRRTTISGFQPHRRNHGRGKWPRLFDGRGSNDKGSRLCVPRSDSGAVPAPTPNYPHFLHSRRGRHFTIHPSDAWIVKSWVRFRGIPVPKRARALRPRLGSTLREYFKCAFHC